MRLWGLLLALAACDRVFGLEPTQKEHDAAIDAPTGCHVITPTLVGDSFLTMADPATAHGSEDALIGSDSDPMLFKFFTSGMIAADERIVDAKLTLVEAGNATQCHTCMPVGQPFGCYYCPHSYESWHLYWMTSSWTEIDASYTDAAAGAPWNAPGATGAADRSSEVAAGASTTTDPVIIEANSDATHKVDPTPWLTADSFSLLLSLASGRAAFGARETGGCGVIGGATLELTVCH